MDKRKVSHATTYADGTPMRAYKLPSGAYFDTVTNELHVPVQPLDAIDAIYEALAGHDLQEFLTADIAQQLETYELCKYMTGRKS